MLPIMRISTIRQKLHQYIDGAEEKKVKAIYQLLEEEIKRGEWGYSDDFKKDLDSRLAYYKKGVKWLAKLQPIGRLVNC